MPCRRLPGGVGEETGFSASKDGRAGQKGACNWPRVGRRGKVSGTFFVRRGRPHPVGYPKSPPLPRWWRICSVFGHYWEIPQNAGLMLWWVPGEPDCDAAALAFRWNPLGGGVRPRAPPGVPEGPTDPFCGEQPPRTKPFGFIGPKGRGFSEPIHLQLIDVF